jgi:hypothetical protein
VFLNCLKILLILLNINRLTLASSVGGGWHGDYFRPFLLFYFQMLYQLINWFGQVLFLVAANALGAF